MLRGMVKAAWLLLAAPLLAQAFEAVDVLIPASAGGYAAYPSEPLPPYSLWGQFGMMYDTNLLRRPTGDNGELVSRLGVGGRYDQRVIGRQSVHLEARVDSYVYNKSSEIDNIGYGGIAEWRYEIGNDFTGTIGASRRRFQANLSEIQRAEYDPITETVLTTTGRLALGPRVGLRGGASYIDYNRPVRSFANLKTVHATAGADYVTAIGNAIGVEGSYAKGDAPVNQLVDPLGLIVNNDYTQRDYGVVGTFIPAPTMRVGGRFGRTHREYSQLPGRDFDGPTGNMRAEWRPTNKTSLIFEASKHISSVIDIGATHLVVKGVAFGPNWAPTAKLNFQARMVRQNQTFEGDPEAELGVAPVRQETVRGYRLGSYWEYNRQLHFTFALDHGERRSNILGRDYRYNAGVANVKYVF